MIIKHIEGATRVLGKSQGYLGLPIRDEMIVCTVNGPETPSMVTAWEPTPDELARLNAGAPVLLRVLGDGHPPVMISVGAPSLDNANGAREDDPGFDAARIAQVIEEEGADGAACGWKPCTGCHETNEGASTGHYPRSKAFGCEVGAGCRECGGLGVVWEHWSARDLEEMAKDLDATSAAPQQPAGSARPVAQSVETRFDAAMAEPGRWRVIMAGARFRLPVRERRTRANWDLAKDVFGLGSTFACILCRRIGLDPDATS
ncbi:hypothetical protein GCM10028812_46270 [Ancylobacter sonchi]|uniref:hypothetical protein n=1 Tax=Ancylobacter sonchi TaxID=1937790 RepID=UPI001FE70CE0|nr:hypothetical protein [Ancylobacter sonchi]